MKRILGLALIAVLGFTNWAKANEGMWLPMFIDRLNYQDMKKMGLKLTPEEIYSVNNSSLKDAIVMLSGGSCTAEAISKDGLLLTNHHCAYGAIQENSSTEHDYLTDGFWAMSRGEELPAEGMTASFLIRMEDVSDVINEALADADEAQRFQIIRAVSDSIQQAAVKDTHYNARVKSFFEGNEFYLFVYETFTDVRLVGAPPSSIGKYGGDTDNWMWPRHTGDFSMLRVYAGQDGKPAEYSKDNIPFQPRQHLPVSTKGVNKEDFAMIMGYPGSTDRYLTSYGVEMAITKDQPARVKIRGEKLAIWKEDMDASADVRIKYASKYASVANYWKYFIGQTSQVKNNKVLEKKQAEEEAFTKWLNADESRKEMYGDALPSIAAGYEQLDNYVITNTYIQEALFGSEVLVMAYRLQGMRGTLEPKEPDAMKLNQQIQAVKGAAEGFFKDYNASTDQKVTAAMLRLLYEDVNHEHLPELFLDLVKKNKEDFDAIAEMIFDKSFVDEKETLEEFLMDPSAKAMDKDPAIKLMGAFLGKYRSEIAPASQAAYVSMDQGNRLFVKGLREMQPNRKFYPNANSTMRLTYGQVLDYEPRDAVHYNFYTTIEGVMEKEDPENDEFIVPEKLKQLYNDKNYGMYADANGELPVCFLTNNDITGGNSGSPVINANGELIGCAFDGNWEAMSGDIFFEKNIQRTIVVDIRYVLFIIDKYAGAKHLVDEMTLAKGPMKEASKGKTLSLPVGE
jgi:hypothetical protein